MTTRYHHALLLGTITLVAGLLMAAPTGQAEETTDDGCQSVVTSPVDVMLALDVSASMRPEIDSSKENASYLIDRISQDVPNATFGLASFSDYYGTYAYPDYKDIYGEWNDHPWKVQHSLGTNLTALQSQLENLTIRNGADYAEAYSRVYLEAAELPAWRADATRILVVWGDAYPHDDDFFDQSFGLDPGRDAAVGGGDDVDFQTVADRLGAAEVRGLMVDGNVDEENVSQADIDRAEQAFRYVANVTAGDYVRLDNAQELADTVAEFVRQVTPADPPQTTAEVPQVGAIYDHGVLHEDGPDPGNASIIGDLAFQASATGQCPIDKVVFETSPDIGWSHTIDVATENETTEVNVTSPAFNGSEAPPGDYELEVTAVDRNGHSGMARVPIEVLEDQGPSFQAPSVCGATHEAVSHEALDMDVSATPAFDHRSVELTLDAGPTGLSLDTGSQDPSTGQLTWSDPGVGEYTVQLTATDDTGLSTLCSFTLDVDNLLPEVDLGWSPAEPDEDTLVDLVSQATDPNGQIVEHAWTLPDGSTLTGAQVQERLAPGDQEVCLTATDDDGDSATACRTIHVDDVPAPTFDPGLACGDVFEGISHDPLGTVNLSATSPSQNRTVSLSLHQAPSGLALDQTQEGNTTTGTVTWEDPQVGTWEVTVRATDSQEEIADCLFTLEITNLLPTVDLDWLPEIPEVGELVNLTSLADDPNGQIVALDWSFPDGSQATGQEVQHSFESAGVKDVCLTATDDDGDDATTCRSLEVEDVRPPTFDLPLDCGSLLEGISHDPLDTLNLSATSPSQNRTVTLSLEQAPADVSFPTSQDGNTTTASLSWDDPQVGTWNMTIVAEDSQGLISECPIDLDVENLLPIVDLDWAPTFPEVGSLIDLESLAEDPNGYITELVWTFPDGTQATGATPSYEVDVAGEREICLTATDDDGDSATGCSIVQVQDVPPPELDLPFECGGILDAISHDPLGTLNLSATSPSQNRTITLTLEGQPEALVFTTEQDGNTTHGSLSWDDPQVGAWNMTLVVEDSDGQLVECRVELDVDNLLPEVGLDWLPSFPEVGTLIDLESLAEDPNGYITELVWTFPDGSQATGATPSYEVSVAGEREVCLTATDDDGDSVTGCDVVQVQDVPPPEIELPIACDGILDAISHDPLGTLEVSATSSSPNRTVTLDLQGAPAGLAWTTTQDGNTTHGSLSWDDPQVGAWNMTIVAEDSDGQLVECRIDLDVENLLPEPIFDWLPLDPEIETLLNFTSESLDPNGHIVAHTWSIPGQDGDNDTQVAHRFTEPGLHEVCLTVTDDDGDDATGCQTVEVDDIPPPEIELPIACDGLLDLISHDPMDPLQVQARSPHHNTTVDLTLVDPPTGLAMGTTQDGNLTEGTVTWEDPQVGTHPLTLRAIDDRDKLVDCTIDLDVVNLPPVVGFSWTPELVTIDDLLELVSNATDPNGEITELVWTADGQTLGTGATIEHGFETPGVRTVCLAATDDDNATTTTCHDVDVQDIPPPELELPIDCSGILDAISHDPLDTLQLSATSPSDDRTVTLSLEGAPAELVFTTSQDGNTTTASLSWDDPQVGTWSMTLIAEDSDGQIVECPIDLDVENLVPEPGFDWFPISPLEDTRILLESKSLDPNGHLVAHTWSIPGQDGDNATSLEHVFASPGDHNVCLVVTDDDGDESGTCETIHVRDVPPPELAAELPCGDLLDAISHEAIGPLDLQATTQGPNRTIDLAVFGAPDGLALTQAKDGTTTNGTLAWQDPQVGTWELSLRAIDSQGEVTTCPVDLAVTNPAPVADLVVDPADPLSNLPVDLIDDSHDPNGELVDRELTLDDQVLAQGSTTHVFDDPGTYQACLTVTDDDGATDTDCRTITVTNPAPEAGFTVDPTTARRGGVTTFDDTSTDENGQIVDRVWHLGDGTRLTGPQVTHVFALPGTYQVCLTVTDDDGATDQACQDLEVVRWEGRTFAMGLGEDRAEPGVTTADTDWVQQDTRRHLAQLVIPEVGHAVHGAESAVTFTGTAVEANASFASVQLPLPTGQTLEIVDVRSRARADCQETLGATYIGQVLLDGEVVAEGIEADEPEMLPIDPLGTQLQIHTTEPIGEHGLQVTAVELRLAAPAGLDHAVLGRAMAVNELCAPGTDPVTDDPAETTLMMQGQAAGAPGMADTGWVETAGSYEVNATQPLPPGPLGTAEDDGTQHEMRSHLSATDGQVETTSHVAEHVLELDALPAISGPAVTITDLTATATTGCELTRTGQVSLGEILLGDQVIYAGSSAVPANTGVDLPGIGSLTLNKQAVNGTHELRVVGVELTVGQDDQALVIPVGLAHVDTDGCPDDR